MTRIRAAVDAVPTVPAWLWFGGVLTVLIVAVTRFCLAYRLFRSASPAPDHIQSLIRCAADELGLRRTPRTLMVPNRVSPMVWCGWRTTLVLPEALWSELDDDGRRAVVQHELAHIRRRDHWVRWAELLVSTLYWWHPVVWWARRRVREEADLSCDLWVTALMPGVRAPYARALLMTKQYVSAGGAGVPSVGIGAVSPGAKRFSRRITMVMTTRMNPRTSIVGVALTASLVLGSVYSAPSWACPKSETPEPVVAPSSPSEPSDLSTFEQYMIDRAPAPPEASSPISSSGSCEESTQAAQSEPCRTTRISTTLSAINGRVQSLVGGQHGYAGVASVYAVGDDDGQAEVVYHLPEDRLRGLMTLMAREDVPVLVEAVDGGILVHGNAELQRRFAAFVAILDPQEELIAYRLTSDGKLKDITSLMAMNSVPTLINIGGDDITVHGDFNTQRAFGEFLEMIDPGAGQERRQRNGQNNNPMVNGMLGDHPLKNEAAKVELRVRGMFDEAQRLREMEGALQVQAEQIEAQAEQIEAQAEQHREHAEAILEEVEEWMDDAESLPTSEQYETMVRAETAQHEASRMMRMADVIESQIDMVLAQAESLAEQAETFGELADDLEDQAEDLADSLDERLEELEDEMGDRIEEFHDWAHDHAESLHSLLQEHAERLDEELSQRFGSGAH